MRRIVLNRDASLGKHVATLQAKAAAERAGLFLSRRPGDSIPELPEDATTLSDQDLIILMTTFSRWGDYAAGQLSLVEVDEKLAEGVLASSEATAMLQLMPNSEALRRREDTITRIKAEIRSMPEIQDCHTTVMEAYALRKVLTPVYERCTRGAALCSRELTRRTDGNRDPVRRSERYHP